MHPSRPPRLCIRRPTRLPFWNDRLRDEDGANCQCQVRESSSASVEFDYHAHQSIITSQQVCCNGETGNSTFCSSADASFQGEIEYNESGSCGFSVSVIPHHEDVIVP